MIERIMKYMWNGQVLYKKNVEFHWIIRVEKKRAAAACHSSFF